MAKARGPTQRRYVREKATIDHLVKDVFEAKASDEEHTGRSPTTSTGLPVEDQVRKEWDPRKVAFPLFTGRDDEPFATSQATAGSRCASKCRRRRRDRHRRLRRSPTRRRSRTTPSSICWTATPARELRAGSVRVPISSSISLWNLIGRRRSRGSSTRLRRQSENAPRKYG